MLNEKDTVLEIRKQILDPTPSVIKISSMKHT